MYMSLNETTLENKSTKNEMDVNSKESLNFIVGQQKNSVEDFKKKEFYDKIKSLHCLFTWDFKSFKKQNILLSFQDKYGYKNIDISKCISTSEFSFVRFIGNLIISYELYTNGYLDASRMKILEIGNWLQDLDKGTDTFYLSINIGLKHIKVASFILMQFEKNEGGYKWLFNEIVLFENMDNKSKAAVYAIHAIILIEFAENLDFFKNACKYANKACMLDPKTCFWYHIYSLVLIAQKLFENKCNIVYSTEKLCKINHEIRLAIRRAIVISLDVKHIYPVQLLLETILNNFPTSKIQVELNRLCNLKHHVHSKYNDKNLEKDLKIVVEKYRNNEDPVLYLNNIITKYDKYNKQKILAQICSYKVLFTTNLRAGVEQFLVLIKEPTVITSDLVIKHNSLFICGSRIFNLAELICNEITLVTVNHFDSVPFDDILFYYKTIIKLKETYGIQIKKIDQSMKYMLNQNSIDKISSTNLTNQCKNSLPKKESVNKNENQINFKAFFNKPELHKSALINKINNLGKADNMNNTIHEIKPNKTEVIDFQVPDNFPFGNRHSNISSCVPPENVIHFQMQTKKQQYAKSQDILTNTEQHYNLHSSAIQDSITQNYIQLYQHLNFTLDLKFDFSLQSILYTNEVIQTNVTSDSMVIDTSLHKLPKSWSKQKYKNHLKILLKNYPFSIKIYTDASKIENNVGIAIVSDKDSFSYKLSSNYSSSDAEAVAILRALDYALTEHFYDFVILSDSLSTLQCIQTLNMNSSDVIKSIVGLLHAHKIKRNIVQFIWVPSHYAIEGNEKADRMAKQIASTESAVIYSHNSFKIMNVK